MNENGDDDENDVHDNANSKLVDGDAENSEKIIVQRKNNKNKFLQDI